MYFIFTFFKCWSKVFRKSGKVNELNNKLTFFYALNSLYPLLVVYRSTVDPNFITVGNQASWVKRYKISKVVSGRGFYCFTIYPTGVNCLYPGEIFRSSFFWNTFFAPYSWSPDPWPVRVWNFCLLCLYNFF